MFEIYIYLDEEYLGLIEMPFVPRVGEHIVLSKNHLAEITQIKYLLIDDSRIAVCCHTRKNYEKQISKNQDESEEQDQEDRSSQSEVSQASCGSQSIYEKGKKSETEKFTSGQLRAARIIILIMLCCTLFGVTWLFISQILDTPPKSDPQLVIPGTANPIPTPDDDEDPPPPPKRKGIYL